MKRSESLTLTSVILITLLGIYFFLLPYLNKREASRIVHEVLNCWTTQNLTTSYEYWLDAKKSPPIFGLQKHTLKNQVFDTKDGVQRAFFTVNLEFSLDNFMPSKRDWILELQKTKFGWKIIDFYSANDKK